MSMMQGEAEEPALDGRGEAGKSVSNSFSRMNVAGAAGAKIRPRFRYVSPLSAEIVKKLLGHSTRVRVRLGAGVFVLKIAPELAYSVGDDVFSVQIGEQGFQIEFSNLSQLLEVPSAWWDCTPGGVRAELLADLLRDTDFGSAVQVAYIGTRGVLSEQEMSSQICFLLESEDGIGAFSLRTRFQTPSAGAMLLRGWEKADKIAVLMVPDLAMPVRVEIFSTTLAAGDLMRLRPGALVPVGDPLEGKDVLVSVGWGQRFVASAVLTQKMLTLQGGLKRMSEAKASGSGISLSELSKMEDIEVQFTVELATCSLPLSELARLGPGSTLNLGLPHEPSLVRLCVNGKAVATGELVVLGQSLGVQVVEMAPA